MIKCLNNNCDYFNNYGECSEVCERNGFKKVITNYDRIMSMSFDELVEFIEKDMLELEGGCIKAFHKCEYVITCGSCVKAPECIKKYLESEVSE